jgi:peptidoglycan/LPS O-acetylase OafA/YrhL
MENRSLSDVGGTTGGLGQFIVGLVMACIGGYLLTNQVKIVSSYWNFWGTNSFGITLIPMLFGVGFLFWNGRSKIGWLLTIGGALFILAGVIANMNIFYAPTSLFNTLLMFILLVGGVVLIARSTRSNHQAQASE